MPGMILGQPQYEFFECFEWTSNYQMTKYHLTGMLLVSTLFAAILVQVKLVGAWATPLKNMSSSVGMMKATQYFWENKKWQPNHQPGSFQAALEFIMPLP